MNKRMTIVVSVVAVLLIVSIGASITGNPIWDIFKIRDREDKKSGGDSDSSDDERKKRNQQKPSRSDDTTLSMDDIIGLGSGSNDDPSTLALIGKEANPFEQLRFISGKDHDKTIEFRQQVQGGSA